MSRECVPGMFLVENEGISAQIVIDLDMFFGVVELPTSRKNIAAVLSAVQKALDNLFSEVRVDLPCEAAGEEVPGCVK